MDLFTWTTRRLRARHEGAGPGRRGHAQHLHREPDPGGHPAHRAPGARSSAASATSTPCPCPPATPRSLYKLDLTEEEQEVLAHVNGRATVEQICQVSYLSNFETCRHPVGAAGAGRASAAGRPGEAAARGRGRARARAGAGPRGASSRSSTRCSAASTASCRAGSGDERRRLHGRGARGGVAPVRRALRRRRPASTTAAPTTSRCWPTWPTCPPSSARA